MPLSISANWWAWVVQRESWADGLFVFAVRTTGIYCRPSCPARRPKQSNAVYFSGWQQAEQAGFRPCKRCYPAQTPPVQLLVQSAKNLLEQPEAPSTLAALAAAVGCSPHHLLRVFRRATGLTPRQYLGQQRIQHFQQLRQQGLGVTQAIFSAGYGSSQAFYRQTTDLVLSKGSDQTSIFYHHQDSVLGVLWLAVSPRGICWLSLEQDSQQALGKLRGRFGACLLEDPQRLAPYFAAVQAYLAGTPLPDLPLDLRGTPFQQQVWHALQQIPLGQTRSYQEVAVAIGRPSAFRAVAQACARNPVPLVVPCHRVVQTGGGLGGYAYGLAAKRYLLNLEKTMGQPKSVIRN
jgi:AraC family transcriptional regulator of adaptative response/methylated-DNA-[protein]-cysteine methyltransferase